MEIEIKTLDEVRDERVQVVITLDGATSTDPARRLYTAQEVGELQASEAELVAAPLRREISMLKLDVDSLQRQLAEANDRCEKNAHVALEGRQLVVELERQRAELTSAMDAQEINHLRETDELRSILRQVNHEKRNLEDALVKSQEATALALNQRNEYDRDRKTERDRADQNKAWAERAEAKVADLLVENKRASDWGHDLETKVSELKRELANVARAVAADRPHMRPTVEEPKEAFLDEMLALVHSIQEIREMTSPWADPPTSRTSQA